MRIKICIGSSCHLKGSRQVVEGLQKRVNESNLGDKVTMQGAFCMGNCQNGVCVSVDDEMYSVSPEAVDSFFEKEILTKLG